MKMTRRGFLRASLAAAAFPAIVPASAFGANERLTMAVVGTGGRGRHLARQFAKLREVRVVAACDVDSRESAKCVGEINKAYGDSACATYADFREVVGRKDIDTVTVDSMFAWLPRAGLAQPTQFVQQ